jgi:serine/threonine-protein kinase
MIGQTVSHYKILEKLGEGGMGVVYKAEDTKLKRTVALKFLPPELIRDPEAKERFIHEAQAASALQHENICAIHDIDETLDGHMFICMDFYGGEPLEKRIEQGPLPIDQAVDIAIQAGSGLEAAHEAGMVHRDIKAANVMITQKGGAKIVDFGLARLTGKTRLTKGGSTLGTIAYMSPEQSRGEDVDQRTDIWSLGVMIYEMLTGQLPFKGGYEQAVVYEIMNAEPAPITGLRTGVPMELERIVTKALAKNRNERYQHVEEMLVDLRSVRKELESGTVKSPPAKPKRKKHTLVFGIVSLVVVLLVAFGIYYLLTGRTEAISSIAVLPLENLSGDKEQEYFVDGMTDELIGELSQISSLRVISRTSIMRYKKTDKSLPQIARELNVGAVVEGTVLRAGDKVRITAQLIEAATDKHVWARNYEGELKDVLALQSSVAQAIAREIKAKLTPQEEKRLQSTRTIDPEVYQLYLKGRYHWNKRTGDELKKAIDCFNQAIEKDPTYALAHAALAGTYVLLPEYAGLPGKEYFPRAEAVAKRALELDENLAEAHAALGIIRQNIAWDWAGAEREYKKAIELNPNYPTAHHWYSNMLDEVGRMDEAMREIKRAQELDPLSLIINANVGDVLYKMRRYDDAIEQCKKTTELDENFAVSHLNLGLAYIEKGMLREGMKECEKARVLVGSSSYGLGELGSCYARSGKESEARKVLNELLAFSKEGYDVSYEIALVYNAMGDKNSALEWLERACEERGPLVQEVKVDPLLDNLRTEPRFKALLQKMGLEK